MQHETFSEILNVSFGRYRTMSISTKLEEFIFWKISIEKFGLTGYFLYSIIKRERNKNHIRNLKKYFAIFHVKRIQNSDNQHEPDCLY